MKSPPRTAEAFAPAKINLTLHVTGQRPDGYHLLDSLVVFADLGDKVVCSPSPHPVLELRGPFSEGLPNDSSNLVCRAKELIAPDVPARILLEKNLPLASGIGGGSSDAAATLRACAECFGRDLPSPQEVAALGADVPVCLAARPCRMRGIGEALTPVEGLPPIHFVLVNTGDAVSTPDVFRALSGKDNRPMPELPRLSDTASLAAWLRTQRNDLELPARGLVPAIGVALALIGATGGCLLARMSGSGATCFGLYATRIEADVAAAALAAARPGWWVRAASDWALT